VRLLSGACDLEYLVRFFDGGAGTVLEEFVAANELGTCGAPVVARTRGADAVITAKNKAAVVLTAGRHLQLIQAATAEATAVARLRVRRPSSRPRCKGGRPHRVRRRRAGRSHAAAYA
jgi:hypothetical protein